MISKIIGKIPGPNRVCDLSRRRRGAVRQEDEADGLHHDARPIPAQVRSKGRRADVSSRATRGDFLECRHSVGTGSYAVRHPQLGHGHFSDRLSVHRHILHVFRFEK